MRIRCLAPAKVNLSLFLGPVRDSDGRHELVTVFDSLSLSDTLELETAERDEVICPGVPGDNLAAAAIRALRAHGWDGPPMRITITKRIPVAAGLAGGSADAAAALRLAMAIVPGRPEELDAIAAELGADVPAQLVPGIAVGTGAGERVERFGPIEPHAVLVLPMDAALATPDVYREADRLGLPRPAVELEVWHRRLVDQLGAGRFPAARELLVNDLQSATVSLCSPVAAALEAVRDVGARHVMVSGSGPTVVGLWWGRGALRAARAARHALRDRWPGATACRPVSHAHAAPIILD